MSLTKNENEIIRNAGSGNQESLNQLFEMARPRVTQYIYRLTLDHHITQDVVQDTLIDMAKCLGKLEDQDKFWPWLRRIAYNKLKNQQRKEFRQKDIVTRLYSGTNSEQAKGLSNLISEELSEVVMSSMRQLKSDHRRVLVLRCYEEMTYPEIADIMERTEFGTRMLFVRAKNALKKKLAKNGMSKAALLTALIAFGKITAGSQAATAQLTSASLNAGFTASLTANITTFAAGAKLTAAVITVMALSSFMSDLGSGSHNNHDSIGQVSAHMLSLMADPQNYTEFWYSYPDGPAGPLLSRFTARDADTGHTIGQWFNTRDGNYFYDRPADYVYLLNHNYYNNDFDIMRLPADNYKMVSAINETYGAGSGLDNSIRYEGAGLFYVKGLDSQGRSYSQAGRLRNIPKEEYFNLTWAKSASLVDLRDDIHKQGWAGVTVSGLLNGKTVNGSGCIPLYLDTAQSHSPWLFLDIAGNFYYSGKSDFLTGFSRPWYGLHTIDSIRRDFAYSKYDAGSIKVADQSVDVTFLIGDNRIVYTVSLDADLVESIRLFDSNGSETGYLVFDYRLESEKDPGNSASAQELKSLLDIFVKVTE